MNKFSFIKSIIRHDLKAFILCFIILGAFVPTLFSLKSDFTHKAFYNHNDPLLAVFQDYEKTFGNDDRLIIVAHFTDEIFSSKNIHIIHDLVEKLRKTKSIVNVESILSYNKITSSKEDISLSTYFDSKLNITKKNLSQLKQEKNIKNYLLSSDFKTVAIYGALGPYFNSKPDYETPVRELREAIKDIKDVELHITGTAAIMEAMSTETVRDIKLIFSMILILLFIICFILFRNIRTTIILLLMGLVTIIMTIELSSLLGVTLTATTAMVPQIILAICILDAIHILTSFQNLQEINSKEDAIRQSLEDNFFPTIMTSITTALGFMSLLWADFVPIQNLGVISGIGTVLAWINTYLMFPFLLRKFGGKYKKQKSPIHYKRFSEFISKYSFHLLILFLIVIIPAGYFATLNRIDSDTLEMFKEDTQVRKSYEFALEHIGGVKGVELILKRPNVLTLENLNKINQLEKRLIELPYISKVLNIRSYILQAMELFDLKESQMNDDYIKDARTFLELSSTSERGLYKWINLDQTQMRISVLWTLSSSEQSIAGINEIKKIAKEVGLDLYVTGKTSMIVGANKYMVQTFFKSILFAIILLSVFMSITFKSLKLGLFSMIPNLVPLILVGGLAYLMGISINMGTVLVASVCLGIAIDDTIHFLSAYHNRKDIVESVEDKVAYILDHIGSALINTTLILVVCFSMFLFGNIQINAEFGLLTAIVLIIALICDLVLLPVLIFTFAKLKKS